MTRSEVQQNVFVRLVMAGRQGRGIRLSAEECWELGGDSPIVTAAQVVAEGAGFDIDENGKLVPLNQV